MESKHTVNYKQVFFVFLVMTIFAFLISALMWEKSLWSGVVVTILFVCAEIYGVFHFFMPERIKSVTITSAAILIEYRKECVRIPYDDIKKIEHSNHGPLTERIIVYSKNSFKYEIPFDLINFHVLCESIYQTLSKNNLEHVSDVWFQRKYGERNMKKFYTKHKRMLVLVIVLASAIWGTIIWLAVTNPSNIFGYMPTIEGELTNYELLSELSPAELIYFDFEYFDMDVKDAKVIMDNPKDYASYYIEYEIRNLMDFPFYDLQANLDKDYSKLWFYTNLGEGQVNICANETVDYHRLWIIVKTKDMTKEDIDTLIKSLRITFRGSSNQFLLPDAYNTIGFRNG